MFASAVLTAMFPLVASGAQDFDLHNRSLHDIDALYISEVGDNQWGPDILGADILKDGDDSEIKFEGYPDGVCRFDLKIEQSDSDGHDGSTWYLRNVDLCSITDMTFEWDEDNGAVSYRTK